MSATNSVRYSDPSKTDLDVMGHHHLVPAKSHLSVLALPGLSTAAGMADPQFHMNTSVLWFARCQPNWLPPTLLALPQALLGLPSSRILELRRAEAPRPFCRGRVRRHGCGAISKLKALTLLHRWLDLASEPQAHSSSSARLPPPLTISVLAVVSFAFQTLRPHCGSTPLHPARHGLHQGLQNTPQ